MDHFHEHLARTGLRAADRYGFALAGGYAVQAAGLIERPSEDVDLFTDWDRREEFTAAVTAVVHAYRDDAVANKMSALYGRAFARDFIDIDATLRSGRYTHDALLALAQRADRGFNPRIFADALGQATQLDPDDFAQYGVTGPALDDLRSQFAEWRRELLDDEEG
ncbi:nucleotidyl transferase AbiEii/AbiGii toxin family protein [Micromonospora rifamycinica]|uniref:nucleotidyl transferase AbiEii/AbiGii toxin family protein n=1 Tax=Micromonospora rifamycinica TaxID=291594 RepID=UPI003432F3EF